MRGFEIFFEVNNVTVPAIILVTLRGKRRSGHLLQPSGSGGTGRPSGIGHLQRVGEVVGRLLSATQVRGGGAHLPEPGTSAG